MKVKISDMKRLLERILARHGLSRKEAEIVADDYLLGEKEGKKSHGISAFPLIAEKLADLKRGRIEVEKEGPSYALINGNMNFGQLVAEKARTLVVKKARKNGIAMVGTYNALTFLRPGTQAEMIEQKGMIGIVTNNGGGGAIAPTGSIDPILATNPIGIGIPANGTPIIADFATAKKAWGTIRIAKESGKKLHQATFIDEKGNFTLDPDKAHSVLPFGDYKGYIIALLVEILTGSLVNMPMGVGSRAKNYGVGPRGALFIAIDPKKFTSYKKFTKANSGLVRRIKNSRKQKGAKEILVPGEMAARNRKESERRGYFEISGKLYEKVRSFDK